MYEFNRSTPVTVAVRTQTGTVEMVAEERDSIVVEVTPVSGSGGAQEAAEKTRVELDGDTLVIQTPGSDSWTWRRSHKLRIVARVPLGSALTGRSAAADVRAAGVWSAVELETASSDVDLAEITGDADVRAASGDITIHRVGGALRAKSASGDVNIGDVTGDVNMETASGDLRLRFGGGSLRASTASGDIQVGRLREGQAQLKSASGDIQVGVAAGTGGWMDLNTMSGKTTSDLTARGGEAPVPDSSATLELRARTASGDIHIHRAAVGTAA
jgi:hypothetical protein